MKSHAHRIKEELILVFSLIVSIWGIYFLDQFLPLERWGLIPREWSGLWGVLTMPFLHADFNHLLNNSIPLIVLSVLLAGSKADTRIVIPAISILGGLILWVFGREALHIGASLLVFGLAAFLVVSGILEKRLVPLLISVFVAFTYGSTVLAGILPWQVGVSWEGHLFGAVAGAAVAWLLLRR